MIDLIVAQGWFRYKSCTCNGILKHKYKHPNKQNKEIWIMPNRNSWEYRISKRVWGSGVGVEPLRIKLLEI